MKRKLQYKIAVLLLVFSLAGSYESFAQDSSKHELVMNLGYFMNNNQAVWLMVHAKTKTDKKFHPVPDLSVNLYLDNDSDGHFLGKVTTDESGDAKAIIPPAMKMIWNNSPTHTFIGKSEANKEFEETKTEITITKTRISIDTISDAGTRSLKASVFALKDGQWTPAKAVEMKVGIARLGGILSAGDAETYTTDSTGSVLVEFKKDSLPGDTRGDFTVVAKVEDNDQYGNLLVEKKIPWGVAIKYDDSFFSQRTLWTTRFRTPFWLLFMAYSIFIGVWGTIIYLVWQIVRIKKLGTEV